MYKTPSISVDALVLNQQGQLLLIERGHDPFKGKWAFPGGRVDFGEEPVKAVLRELREETTLEGTDPALFGVYGHPDRDPRTHMVAIVYRVQVQDVGKLKADDDANAAKFWDIEELQKNLGVFAFDHAQIFQDFVSKHCKKRD